MSKYILGGGLSGLIAAKYNPEYTLLTYEFGGFIDSKFGRAFVVLHEDDDMIDLFEDLQVDVFVKELKIAYYSNSWPHGLIRSFDEPEQEHKFARKYVEEKLPPSFQPGKDLELSAPGDEWRALFVDGSIVDALKQDVDNVRTGLIENVREDVIEFRPSAGDTEELEWDSIISSVPAHVFQKMSDKDLDWSLKHHPTTYVEMDFIPQDYRTKPWNVLYAVDSMTPCHRIVRNMLSGNFFGEALGKPTEDLSGSIELPAGTIPNSMYVDHMTNGIGVIADEDLDPPYDGIQFLGRYAQWRHDVLINDVLERAKEGL